MKLVRALGTSEGLAPTSGGQPWSFLILAILSSIRLCRVRVCLGRPSEARKTSTSPPRSEPATPLAYRVALVEVIQPAEGAGRVRV